MKSMMWRRRRGEKATEDSVIEKEQLLVELMNASEDAELLIEDGYIKRCNLAARCFFTLAEDCEITHFTPLKFAPERQPDGLLSREKWRKHVEVAEKKHFCRFDFDFLGNKSEVVVPSQVTLTQVSFNGRQLIRMTLIDMTEYKAYQGQKAQTMQEEQVLGELFELSCQYSEMWEFLSRTLKSLTKLACLPVKDYAAVYVTDSASPTTLRPGG